MFTGVEEQRKKDPNDKTYVPKPPCVKTVLAAFEIAIPENASQEEQAAVRFFNDIVLTPLDSALSSDAMIGKSVMEVLDLKTEEMSRELDANVAKGRQKKEWKNKPNTWAATMATAAMFMDKESGACDTDSIVTNLTREVGATKVKPKHFGKTGKDKRYAMYGRYYTTFQNIWLENRKCEGKTQMVKNLEAWDRYTGMTKTVNVSDAQKRAREMAMGSKNDTNKRSKLDEDDLTSHSGYKFLDILDDGDELPPLTNDINNKRQQLQREQDEEVAQNHSTRI